MRAIETEEVRDARDKRNRLIGGLFLIGVLLLSTLGYALVNRMSSDDTTTTPSDVLAYNGQYWSVQKYGKQLAFTYSPNETSEIPIDMNYTLADFASHMVFVDAGTDDTSLNELAFNLNGLSGRIQKGCYGTCASDLPEKNCTGGDLLVVIRDSQEKNVRQDQSCVFIDGNLASVDAFLYRILEVS